MTGSSEIHSATERLREYIESRNYRGYDPYDGLMSPLFKSGPLYKSKLLRFGFQQFVKRFPLNIRPLMGIRKGCNPVTLGLCMQAYSNLIESQPGDREQWTGKITYLFEELEKMIPEGYKGSCWGYDFDWEARYARIPAFQPSLVATGFVTNALFRAYKHIEVPGMLQHLTASTRFILEDINRTYDAERKTYAFSYSPFDHEVVFNATMKGARALAQVYSITGEKHLKEEAAKAIAFVMKYQRADGAWEYSTSKSGTWVDNYHTGYILDCLHEYISHTGDDRWKAALASGYRFYREHFITSEGIPGFYDNGVYPVDATAAAQTLLTLCRFGDTGLATKVAGWMTNNMQDAEGYFYFRKFRYYTIRIPFMRWSNAWMFAGLTELMAAQTKSSPAL